jgi:hypothetical protein
VLSSTGTSDDPESRKPAEPRQSQRVAAKPPAWDDIVAALGAIVQIPYALSYLTVFLSHNTLIQKKNLELFEFWYDCFAIIINVANQWRLKL